jgi:predicted permease
MRGRSDGVSPAQRRTWAALVAVQAALALLLLAGAGLLVRSFQGLLAVEPGFDAARVATLQLAPPQSRYPDQAATAALHQRLLLALAAEPEIEAVGFTSELPLDGMDQGGQMLAAPDRPADASYRVASGGFFRALRIPLLSGRLFDDRDRQGTRHSAIVDRAAAELFWHGESPLGKRISSEGMDEWGGFAGRPREWATVVGVVGDVRQRSLERAPRATVYFAMAQRPVSDVTLVARSHASAGALVPLLARTLLTVAPDVPGKGGVFADALVLARAQRRFSLLVLAVFAGLALALAAVGVYGVVAYAVSRRTRELGVRLALGAAPRQARALVLRGALAPVALGALVGLLLATPLSRTLAAMLFGVRPWDPASWLAALLLLGAAATLAAWAPARRAARLDPVCSLREE